MKSQLGLIAAAILLASFILPSLDTRVLQEAEAWNNFTCKWGTSTVTWKSIDLSSTFLAETKVAVALWNNVGANIFLDQTTGAAKVEYRQASDSGTDLLGWTNLICDVPNSTWTEADIYLNSFTIGSDAQKLRWTSGHETGHALGVDHTEGADSDNQFVLMRTAYNGLIAPTLDDIRALKTKYGAVTSTSQCTEWTTNGDVTYTGTCSGTNPALDMREYVITAASNSKAVATTTSGSTTLPSSNVLLITAKVKATTLNKFQMGVWTGTDIASTANRVMAIEVASDGFYIVRSSSTGFTRTAISTTAPTLNQVYFIELVIKNGAPSVAYVFRDNGGSNDPPSYVGSGSATATVSLPWSSSVYMGTGDWMTSSTQSKPDYTISEYHNLKKSWT